jgi:hypothetical protein
MFTDIQKEYSEKGKNDGIEKAKEISYENGFRDGVQKGIEFGISIQFLESLKDILSKHKENDAFINKIITMINKADYDDLDDLQNKMKAVKTNVKVMMNKKKTNINDNSQC